MICNVLAQVLVPGKFFQPSLMFWVRPGAYPIVEHLRASLTHKHYTGLEKLAWTNTLVFSMKIHKLSTKQHFT